MRSIIVTMPLLAGLLFAQSQNAPSFGVITAEATAVAAMPHEDDVMFDVRYHDDRGKLIVTDKGVNFEDISNAKHSRSWTYAQIKELKRDGKEIKIDGYSSDAYEFHVSGKLMSDEIYRTIADRIVAARAK